MWGYHVPAPDEAMLISGGKASDGAPFEVVVGHGKRVGPRRRVRFLSLAMQESKVTEHCNSQQAVPLDVTAVIAFKVGNDNESIINAGQRFVSDADQMPTLAGRIFAGHLRSIIGAMTVEDIIRERQKLAIEVLDASKTEMAKIGLTVDSFQIQSIDDGNSGYIKSMSAPHLAAVQRDAQIAQAQAAQEAQIAQAQAQQIAVQAQQESEQKQLGYKRATSVAQAQANAQIAAAEQEAERQRVEANRLTSVALAEAKAQVDKANATAAQAGPLSEALARQDVLSAQTKLGEQNTLLAKQRLQAEVVAPAEAEAEKVRALAQADAERTRLTASALAESQGVTLDRMLIDKLPEIVKEAAGGLAGANVTVVNGADGLGEIVMGLVTQATTILDGVRKFRNDVASTTVPNTSTSRAVTSRASK